MEALFKDLNTVPRYAYDFLWADYVELLCLCSQNRRISSGNIQAYTEEASDTQVEFQSDDQDAEDPDVESEALDDKVAARWDDIHRRLQARAKSWPDDWPFQLEQNFITCQFDDAKPGHRLYVALLVASVLRLCHSTRRQEITNAFEELSYHWLQQSLNAHWEVWSFGAHQKLSNTYKGGVREKLEALAKDIHAMLRKPATDYDPRDSGDAGIDLVAWMKMGDQRGNLPVIFGQCACSPNDWESKQLSVSPSSVEAHITPDHPGAAYCFSPHDLRDSNTKWQRASHVLKVVLVDRARILHLFRETQNYAQLSNWPFVQEPAQLRLES